jgi:hypothetical protein
MKYHFSLTAILFFICVNTALSKLRFGIILKEKIAERPVRKVGIDTCTAFQNLIGQLLVQDQKAREIDSDSALISQQISDLVHHLKITPSPHQEISTKSIRNINSVDSISFQKLKSFAGKYGLMQLNRENFTDSGAACKLMFDFNTILIHLSDKYGLEIMSMYEQAIQKNTCNETDLLNYIVNYLWRRTEFDKGKFEYFIVPLPDIDKSLYKQVYLDAIRIFINSYVKTSNNVVQYMVFANYFTLSRSRFLVKTSLINQELQNLGTALPFIQLEKLNCYIMNVIRQFPANLQAWQNPSCKYYFVCNNLGLKIGPYQEYTD